MIHSTVLAVTVMVVLSIGQFLLPAAWLPAAQAADVVSPQGMHRRGVQRPVVAIAMAQSSVPRLLSVPSDELRHSESCLDHLQAQRYEAAIGDCTQALVLNPSRPESWLNRGLAYFHLGDYAQAIQHYQWVLHLNPADYRASYNLGLVQSEQGQQREAIASYSDALSAAPRQPEVQAKIYRDRGTAWLLLADYSMAIADFDQAITQLPSNALARFNRGCAYHRSHQWSAALEDFDWVIAQDAGHAQAYFNRGFIYGQMGQGELAWENLQTAAELFQRQGDGDAAGRSQQLLKQLQPVPVETAIAVLEKSSPSSFGVSA